MPATTASVVGTRGAYGLQLNGIDTCATSLVEAPADWPAVTIERVTDPRTIERNAVEDDWAEYRPMDGNGSIRVERDPLVARFRTARGLTGDDALLHPGLAMMSAIVSRWLDRDAMHAGAFVTDAGAWAVLGAKEAGKSSLLARLSMRGMGVACDDVLVVERGHVLAGPRFLDLREGAAAHLGAGVDIGVVGTRRRWRVATSDVPAVLPLAGWILPEWGDEMLVESLPPSIRISALYANLALTRIPKDPFRLLDLASLPFVSFRRPRSWTLLEASIDHLLDRLDRITTTSTSE